MLLTRRSLQRVCLALVLLQCSSHKIVEAWKQFLCSRPFPSETVQSARFHR